MPNSPTAKISPDFLAQMRKHPDAEVQAIVRCSHIPADAAVIAQTRVLSIIQQFQLIQGLTVRGRASALLDLTKEDWIISIEPDQTVHTMPG